jgi:hypothetical protein
LCKLLQDKAVLEDKLQFASRLLLRGPLSSKIFSDAIRIARFFADRQLEVLQRLRIKALDEQRDRLKEVFAQNGEELITLRDLQFLTFPDP